MHENSPVIEELGSRFPGAIGVVQQTVDSIPTVWISAENASEVLRFLKTGIEAPYRTLYDLFAVDERFRSNRQGLPESDFTVVYHLLSYGRNQDIRVKVPLKGEYPSLPSVTDIWPPANWYEREAWDMFGITFGGHPHLKRILMPPTWEGHPLRKEHPARATEMGPFRLPGVKEEEEQRALLFRPEEWGLKQGGEDTDYLFLNLGRQHPGTHGRLRVRGGLDGDEIVDAVPGICYHHRGA